MAKHNDKEFDDKIKMNFRIKLEEVFKNGMTQGVRVVCRVILDRANSEGKSEQEKLDDIISFCQSGLPEFKKTNKPVGETE